MGNAMTPEEIQRDTENELEALRDQFKVLEQITEQWKNIAEARGTDVERLQKELAETKADLRSVLKVLNAELKITWKEFMEEQGD